MYRSSTAKILFQALIVAAGFVLVSGLTVFIEETRPPLPEQYGDTDLTVHGAKLRGFAFGMEGLLADWYYMRALQYIGDKIIRARSEVINIDDLSDLDPRLLYPLLDNATDLDPHFIEAYLYGAIVMPAINPQQAVAIAEKGVANNPDEWRIYRQLGYIYWKLGQYEKASEVYKRGSTIAGASPFMELMAAAMKTKGGSRETARAIYREMLDSAEDDQIRITAERRLAQLDSLDERDAIDKVLAGFKEASGRCPSSFSEIFPKLENVALPEGRHFRVDMDRNIVDPTNVPYILDRVECKAILDESRTGIAKQ
jgi:tetratricopeptide (TPR) repeat protein